MTEFEMRTVRAFCTPIAPPPQIYMLVVEEKAFNTEQDKIIESAMDNDDTFMAAMAPPLTKNAFESVNPLAEHDKNWHFEIMTKLAFRTAIAPPMLFLETAPPHSTNVKLFEMFVN